MATKREVAITALSTLLLQTFAEVWRATDVPRDIPPWGLIEVAEGDSVEQPLLSPLRFEIDQQVELYVSITAEDEHARDAALDALLGQIHTLVTADRTLGGAVDDTMLGSPSYEPFEADGAAKVARLPCTLSFTTTSSPLG